MAPVLAARGLHKTFGAVVAAADIDVAVEERECLGIIGANGAGKTTFVNLVTGHLKPSRGTIQFQGRDITDLRSREITRLGICRSFQIPQLFSELTVLDNLLVAIGVMEGAGRAAWQRFRRPDTLALAGATLERYGLSAYADSKASLLPQGVRKLLDIAMAMVKEPKVVLLDEPTSGISVDEKFAIMDTLMAALKAAGATVMFVEHDMEIVERYASRVVAFYDGRIIADGAPAAVLADPDVRQYVVGAELHRRPAAPEAASC
jgi:branched-chain amino acid transport system ATP-binding protein